MKKFTLLYLLGVLFIILPNMVKGQDIHYTQFYNSPLNLSPGLTGIYDGDHRFSGHFRRQWQNVPVDYLTFTGSYDGKIYPKKTGENFFGGGIHFNYDRSGFSKLQLAQLALSGSYSIVLNSSFIITPGIQAGISQRAFREDGITTDSQFDSFLQRYEPGLPTGENFENLSIVFANLGAGLNFRLQKDARTNIDFGVGAFHLNRPDQAFFSSAEYKLASRFTGYLMGTLQLINNLDLVARGATQFQGEYNENLAGLGLRFHLNQQRGKQLNLLIGANARFSGPMDAIAPTIEVEFNTLKVAASYDINISDFQLASEYRGGPEVAVIYRIVKVKPLKVYKTCPIY